MNNPALDTRSVETPVGRVACTADRFLDDVKSHVMTILRDDGVYRHLRFAQPGTSNMSFSIITWPGYLCYAGDMGSYVFCRLNDMFEFFRTAPERHKESLYINTGYWAEKLTAVDRDGVKQYCPDKFRRKITEILTDNEADSALTESVAEQVLAYADEGERDAREAADQFEHEGRLYFADFCEVDLQVYTFRFLWCCYAIAWAVQKYDAANTNIRQTDFRNTARKESE